MKTKQLLLVLTLCIAAGGIWIARAAWRAHRQLVTLDITNAPLGEVLRKIEGQVWQKIRSEEALANVHVKLFATDTPLSEVLDQLAEQVGASWNTVYAVYSTKRALTALDSALQGDGKVERAGWTKIAPVSTPSDDQAKTQKNRITVQIVPRGNLKMWSPQELVLEASLVSRLGNYSIASNVAPTTATAAQAARKVNGRWTTFFALQKTRRDVRFTMPRRRDVNFEANKSSTNSSGTTSRSMKNEEPPTERVHRPPNATQVFQDFTPEQRVKFAREKSGPGG